MESSLAILAVPGSLSIVLLSAGVMATAVGVLSVSRELRDLREREEPASADEGAAAPRGGFTFGPLYEEKPSLLARLRGAGGGAALGMGLAAVAIVAALVLGRPAASAAEPKEAPEVAALKASHDSLARALTALRDSLAAVPAAAPAAEAPQRAARPVAARRAPAVAPAPAAAIAPAPTLPPPPAMGAGLPPVRPPGTP